MNKPSIFLISGLSLLFSQAVFSDVQFLRADFNLGSYIDSRIHFFDKDNDGDLDAITFGVNSGSNIYRNNGTGFSLEYTSNAMENALLTADVNQDGFQDIITYPFKISLNDRTGKFSQPGSSFSPINDAGIYELSSADLDNNGVIDVLVSHWTSSGPGSNGSGSTSVYMNVLHDTSKPGNFAYGYAKDYGSLILNGTAAADKARGVAIGDLNGDGFADLLLINAPNVISGYLVVGGSTVMLNNGAGGMTPIQFISGAEDIDLGDLDGDGDLDAYLAIGGNRPDEVWLNDGAGRFTNSGQLLGNSDSIDCAMADLDKDGDLDVVSVNNNASQYEPHTIWLNNGTGQLTKSDFLFGSYLARILALVDFDQDSDIDIVVQGERKSDQNGGYINNSEIWINQLVSDSDTTSDIDVNSIIQLCKDYPNDYGLFSQNQLDQAILDANTLGIQDGIQEGIQMCQDSPHTYGLKSQADLDHALADGQTQGIQQGIQSCVDNPSACGLFNQTEVDNNVKAAVNQAVAQIINDLPRGQIVSICKKNPSSLLCQPIN